MKEPKIRFKEFKGEWETIDFQDSFMPLKNNSLSRAELCNEGEVANIHYGDILINYGECLDTSVDALTYICDSNAGKGLLRNGALKKGDIIFADAAEDNTVGKCIELICKDDEKIVSGLHTIASRPKIDIAEKYLGYYLNSHHFHNQLLPHIQGTKISSISKRAVNTTFIVYPFDYQEQQSIASFFTTIDAQISASTSRLASLKQIKAASLQAMFPQEGETMPKLRFKGFEGEWEKVKISEIFSERHEPSTITQELPQLSFTIAEGVIRPEDRKSNKRDFLIKDIDNKRYLVTRIGDIIYNPANVVFGAIHRNGLCDGVVSPIYKIFYTEQDSIFLECNVRRPNFITKLAMSTEGTVTKLKTLKPEAFLEMEIFIAKSLEEQRAIGEYFQSLDRQITLQARRLEKLKQIKAACLDKMFV